MSLGFRLGFNVLGSRFWESWGSWGFRVWSSELRASGEDGFFGGERSWLHKTVYSGLALVATLLEQLTGSLGRPSLPP